MIGPFVITLREGLEAALVIGIILAYLAKTNNRAGVKSVWTGAALALAGSLLAGGAVYLLAGELKDPAEAIFEGIVMLLAVAVLTWMIFWMRKQSKGLKASLHSQIDSAVSGGSSLGLALIAFLAVIREGIETVLFLFAATRTEESPATFIAGGILGLLIAAVIGYTIYKGTSRLNLKTFFNITGLLLIIFGAGLLAHGVHEFNELGYLPGIIDPVWDLNGFINESSGLGRLLAALLGYNPTPFLTEVIAWFAYLIVVPALFFRSNRSTPAKQTEKPAASSPVQKLPLQQNKPV